MINSTELVKYLFPTGKLKARVVKDDEIVYTFKNMLPVVAKRHCFAEMGIVLNGTMIHKQNWDGETKFAKFYQGVYLG